MQSRRSHLHRSLAAGLAVAALAAPNAFAGPILEEGGGVGVPKSPSGDLRSPDARDGSGADRTTTTTTSPAPAPQVVEVATGGFDWGSAAIGAGGAGAMVLLAMGAALHLSHRRVPVA